MQNSAEVEFKIHKGEVTGINVISFGPVLVVPEGVTHISKSVFDSNRCKYLFETIILPSTLREIGPFAFWGQHSLKSISLPDGLTRIGKSAFGWCGNLLEIRIPSLVKIIEEGAFSNCKSLKKVELPDALETIEEDAFFACYELREIFLPTNTTNVVFPMITSHPHEQDRIKLEAIYVDKRNSKYQDVEGVLFSKDGKILYSVPSNYRQSVYPIPDGTEQLFHGSFYSTGRIEEIQFPPSLQVIGSNAFSCSKAHSLHFSTGLTSIGTNAFIFSSFTEISIPNTVTSLGEKAFQFSAIQEVDIPEGILKLETDTFSHCGLKRIGLSDTIEEIEKNAFVGNENSLSIEFHSSPLSSPVFPIEKLNLPVCKTLVVSDEIREKIRQRMKAIQLKPLSWATYFRKADPLTRAYALFYQNATIWMEWELSNTSEINDTFKALSELILGEKKMTKPCVKRVTSFLEVHFPSFDSSLLTELIIALKTGGRVDEAKHLEEQIIVQLLLNTMSFHHVERYVLNHTTDRLPYALWENIQQGFPFADGSGVSSTNVPRMIAALYYQQWVKNSKLVSGHWSNQVEVLSNGGKLLKNAEADYVASFLDKESLCRFFSDKLNGNAYRLFLIPYSRYASEQQVEALLKEIAGKSRGTAKEKYWANSAEEALFLSDTRAAVIFFNKKGRLQEYANMRGRSPHEIREKHLFEDFGFDHDGVRVFDLGSSKIKVSLGPELKLQIYDTETKKELSSFPRTGKDQGQLITASQIFAELKKTLGSFVKERVRILHQLYLSGGYLSSKLWFDTYIENPIVRSIAKMLVWADSQNKQFIVSGREITDIHGQSYHPVDDIRLVHVLEMTEKEIGEWQDFLANGRYSQVFPQLWEPLILPSLDMTELSKRYQEAVIAGTERNDFKKRMDAKGVTVRSESDFNLYNSLRGFSSITEATMHIGNLAELDYEVNDGTKELTLKQFRPKSQLTKRALNTIVFELDKTVLKHLVKQDKSEFIISHLQYTTLAQVNELINLAIQYKAVSCTALLMDHKNKNYPQYSWLDELSLDITSS